MTKTNKTMTELMVEELHHQRDRIEAVSLIVEKTVEMLGESEAGYVLRPVMGVLHDALHSAVDMQVELVKMIEPEKVTDA